MQNVLYVPDFKFNLLSVYRLLTDHKLFTLFFPNQYWIQDLSTRRVMAVARGVAGLYKLLPAGKNSSLKNKDLADYAHTNVPSTSTSFSSSCNVSSLAIFHARLGHTSASKMQHIPSCNNVPSSFSCEICVMPKMHKLPFNKSNVHSSNPFHPVHMDL